MNQRAQEKGMQVTTELNHSLLLTKPPSLSSPLLSNIWLVTLVTHGIVFQISLISNSTINNQNHRNVQYPTSSSTLVGAVEMVQLLGALAAWKMHGGPLMPIPAPFPGEKCCWMSSICFLTTCHSSRVYPFSWQDTRTQWNLRLYTCAHTHTLRVEFETVYITQAAMIQVVRL